MKNPTGIRRCCDAVLFGIAALLAAECIAQNTPSDLSTEQDCAKIQLQVPDGALLTREEKIALYDKALLESLNKYDPCRSAGAGADGAGGGGAAGGGSGAGGDGASGDNESAGAGATGNSAGVEGGVASVPAGDVQGDMPASELAGDGQGMTWEEINQAGKPGPNQSAPAPPNGKAPEDIPPAENDDIIAKQFRRAAMEETDPATKARLWNEYRRYKNLPVQEVPES